MKFLFDIFLVIGLPLFGMSQAPQGIPYQAIARNASGQPIASTAVKVRFTIRDSIATGAIKYQETHKPTTSALGLFSVNVGMGTVVSGSFSGINWGKNAKFLQVEMDPAGGANYTDLGTTQMMSVPYALYAGSAPLPPSLNTNNFTSIAVFDNPGNFTWTAPENVSRVIVECWGGGGGGTQNACCTFNGGSGGSYGKSILSVISGTSYSVVVGVGGIFYNYSNGGTNLNCGGTSSFGNLIYASGCGGASNGTVQIAGEKGTVYYFSGGGSITFGGDSPLGGGGGKGESPNGQAPGGGGSGGNGAPGRVIIYY